MSAEQDLHHIESQIARLVREYCGIPNMDYLGPSLTTVMQGVIDQAAASSEGGKRLRALLTLAAYDCVMRSLHSGDMRPANREAVVTLACALEVFQTAALVHDDIIDESDLRRGKPSAHRALAGLMHSDVDGNGLGIMLGDLLATASIRIAHDATRPLPHAQELLDVFVDTQHDVEIGQVLDVATATIPLNDPAALAKASLDVFRWKTASYTTIAPLHLAFLAAGMAPREAKAHALAIGEPLGVAFQLADDLLDVTGSSKNTGKPIGGDIKEGKRTVLLADLINRADEEQRTDITAIFCAPTRSDEDVDHIIDLYQRTGALDASRDRIRQLWNESCAALGTLGLQPYDEAALRAMCAHFVPSSLVSE
ncbi:polyprenyl synthetase family protein [Bifidobacterium magnum]|uniref:polyprenyl synthetase family protein n=1 Tax=Bifidobacterium magnum TaxID=1692 RepID=UPI0003B7455B|nr:polyprenyl synthetase family protein [Bifidobacterium magnum]